LAPEYTKPKTQTREAIDQKLEFAGWLVQDKKRLNLYSSLGVVVCEMDTGTGPADYILVIDGKACGITGAKRETAGGHVAEQSRRNTTSKIQHIQHCVPDEKPKGMLKYYSQAYTTNK